MRTRTSAVACLLLLAATVAAGRGAQAPQDPPEPLPPVFRVDSDFIRVDMYATLDGEFVTDLRPDEVQIFEDGVPQQVQTFEYVHIPGDETPGVPERPPGSGEQEVSDPRNRVFVIFIDTHTTELQGDNDLRLSLVRFLDRLLKPDDLVGLMTPDMPVSAVTLDRRSSVISNLANDVRWLEEVSRDRADLTEFAWENCYPSARGPSRRLEEMKARRNAIFTMDALHDLMWHLRSLREERKAVLLVTGGWPFVQEFTLDSATRGETSDCAEDRTSLAKVDYEDLLEDVTEAANRANVSFYPVSSRHPFEPPERVRADVVQRMRQRETRARNAIRDQLRMLAEKTDGVANVDGDFDSVAARVIADTSSYYLIGYQSTNTTPDGRFRSIDVKVTRPGVEVRARPGYGGPAPAPRVTPSPVPTGPPVDARVLDALAPVERFDSLARFWLRLSAWEPDSGGEGGAFWFVGELGVETRAEPQWRDGATAEVVVLDNQKEEILTRTFELAPDDGGFMMRVPADGRIPPGDYSVRVRVRPAADDQVSVFDSASVRLASADAGPGEAVFWRRGPSATLEYVHTADPRFRRTERLRLELPTMSTSPASARLLDRFGQPLDVPLEVSERSDGSSAFRWIVIDAPLAGLAPAYYTVETIQDGVPRFTAFQIVP